jgi:hypothetical protein
MWNGVGSKTSIPVFFGLNLKGDLPESLGLLAGPNFHSNPIVQIILWKTNETERYFK